MSLFTNIIPLPYRLFLSQTLGLSILTCALILPYSPGAKAKTIAEGDFAEIQKLVPKSEKLTKTIPRLKEKIKANPHDADLRLLLAKAHLSAGETAEAITVLRAINADLEPRALVLLSLAFEKSNDPLEQIRALELLKKLQPTSEWVALELGKTYLRSNNIPKATEVLKERITSFPKKQKPYYALLDVYEKAKNSYESRILLSDMTKIFPNDREVFNRLCRFNLLGSFIEQALEICPQAIEMAPQYADNHVYLGLAKKYNKEPEASEKILKKAAQQFTKSEFAQRTYAELLLEQKNFDGAKRTFMVCLKSHPNSGACWVGKANTTFQLGLYEEALPAFKKACEIDPLTRTEFRNAIAALRIKSKNEMAIEYNKAFEKCGAHISDSEE